MSLVKRLRTFIIFLILLIGVKVTAQVDSAYIRPFDHDFSVRSIVGHKIAGFDRQSKDGNNNGFIYRINAPVAFGAGASWKDYSFAFSRRFSFIRDRKKGKTSSLEFQHHGYSRKFTYSISLQQHKGFYNDILNQDGTYTTYPDLKINIYGGTFQWVFNNKKFSYKAAFGQNERQIKSAGSFQLGTSLYYSILETDSTKLLSGISHQNKNLQFGINGGYAYTHVLDKRWFVTGSFDLGINIGNNDPGRLLKEKLEIYPVLYSRIGVGYNIQSWSFGFSSYFSRIYLFIDKNENLSMNEFNMQISFIKRFHWGNKFVNKTLQDTKDKLNRIGL